MMILLILAAAAFWYLGRSFPVSEVAPAPAASGDGGGVDMFGLPKQVSDLIDKYAAKYGVDANLAKAQAAAESGGNQNARSKVGAIGVFQLMPKTAAGLGVDPAKLEDNIKGGVLYLSQMLKRYGGNTALALAAYNAGPGNVDKYGGIPPFAETKAYVKKILTAIGIPYAGGVNG